MSEPKVEATNRKSLSEYFEKAWGQALIAVSAAEEEASKAIHRVGEMAGWSADEVKRQVRELTERLVQQRKDLEKNVEEGVKKTLSRLKVPRREELQDFQARLEKLSARIDKLSEKN